MIEYQKQIIIDYIRAYNAFDISGMIKNLHPGITFENITNGEVDLVTNGLDEFKTQAAKAIEIFSQRKQMIESWIFEEEKVIIGIDYEGILAIDLPGIADKGDSLALKGESEFYFEENKIIAIKDKS